MRAFAISAMLTFTFSAVAAEVETDTSDSFGFLEELYPGRERFAVRVRPIELKYQTNSQNLLITGLSDDGMERLKSIYECKAVTLPGQIFRTIDPMLISEEPRVIGSHMRTYLMGDLSAEEVLNVTPIDAMCVH